MSDKPFCLPVTDDAVQIHVIYAHGSVTSEDELQTQVRKERLGQAIYDWFRIPEQRWRGIPVRVWALSDLDKTKGGILKVIEGKNQAHYLIPLIDAEMVSQMAWHTFLENCLESVSSKRAHGTQMFPVAMDSTATNFRTKIAAKNFIPFKSEDGWSSACQRVLKDLTEGIARDLNRAAFKIEEATVPPPRIFISYARKDGPEVARRMRDYIHGSTQSDAFLDENDIGFGTDFMSVISKEIEEEQSEKTKQEKEGRQSEGKTITRGARGMIVVLGDQYADRPICREEIQKFLQPTALKVSKSKTVFVFHPVFVIDNLSGIRLTRTLPELGMVPTMRWSDNCEAECFNLLMREMLIGFRNTILARDYQPTIPGATTVAVLNRLPGPLLVSLVAKECKKPQKHKLHLHHFGAPTSLLERKLYEQAVAQVSLVAVRDNGEKLLLDEIEAKIYAGKWFAIIWEANIDWAGNGCLPNHIEELVIEIARPLVRAGASIILYDVLPDNNLDKGRMFSYFADLMGDERELDRTENAKDDEGTSKPETRRSQILSLVSEGNWRSLTKQMKAEWISVCSFEKVANTCIEAVLARDTCARLIVVGSKSYINSKVRVFDPFGDSTKLNDRLREVWQLPLEDT